MAPPRILNVGQCGFDHGSISRYLHQNLGARVEAAETSADALEVLRSEAFDLVLVNRIGDHDGQPGLDLIRTLKADAALSKTPVMLVSNYEEAQQEAVRAGAIQGFGKSDLNSDRVTRLLRSVLGDPA